MKSAYILLGSNLGNSLQNLQNAIDLIQKEDISIIACSHTYKTKAWGNVNQDDFLNATIEIKTLLSPVGLLETLLKIELNMGRVRGEQQWLPRIIDLDILYYDNQIIDLHNLKIPHPYIAQRRFTLVPLNDIAANFIHPLLQISNNKLLQICSDKGEVLKTNFELTLSNPHAI
jgi:2-amino-4-hydroxy-6-hydroxymethyldihydropteridine diphosphokinase